MDPIRNVWLAPRATLQHTLISSETTSCTKFLRSSHSELLPRAQGDESLRLSTTLIRRFSSLGDSEASSSPRIALLFELGRFRGLRESEHDLVFLWCGIPYSLNFWSLEVLEELSNTLGLERRYTLPAGRGPLQASSIVLTTDSWLSHSAPQQCC